MLEFDSQVFMWFRSNNDRYLLVKDVGKTQRKSNSVCIVLSSKWLYEGGNISGLVNSHLSHDSLLKKCYFGFKVLDSKIFFFLILKNSRLQLCPTILHRWNNIEKKKESYLNEFTSRRFVKSKLQVFL